MYAFSFEDTRIHSIIDKACNVTPVKSHVFHKKQKRSTEGCSKFKSPETRQVQERLSCHSFMCDLERKRKRSDSVL